MNRLNELGINKYLFNSLIIVSVLIMIFSYMNHFTAEKYGELTGQFIAYWVVLAGLSCIKSLNFISKKNYVVILFICLQVFMLKKFITERNEIHIAADTLLKTINQYDNATTQKQIQKNDSDADLLNKINTTLKQLLDENKEKFKAFSEERDAIDLKFKEMLSPSKLSTSSELNQARKTIRLYRDYLSRFRVFLDKLSAEKTKKLTKTVITSTAFWDKYKIGKEKSEKNWAMYFETENRLLDVVSMMINIIESNQGHLTVEKNAFLFENTDELKKYNEYIAEIEALSEKEDTIINKIQSSEDKFKNTLEHLKQDT